MAIQCSQQQRSVALLQMSKGDTMDSDAWAVALSEPHELMYMCKQYSKNKAHFRKHRRLGKAKVNESLSSCNVSCLTATVCMSMAAWLTVIL